MAKVDYAQTNFTAGEISPRMLGRQDVEKYGNGALLIENGVISIFGGVDRRDGLAFCAPAKLNEDRGAILIGYIYNVDQAFMLEFGHLYVRFYTSTGAVVGNGGGGPLELATPYSREQLSEITYTQRADTMLLFHPEIPPQRLRRLSATSWSISPVPFVAQPFDELGHVPDSTLTISNLSPGPGRLFAAGAGTPPSAPGIATPVPLNGAANVNFSAPASSGGAPISSYTALSNPGGFTGTDIGSPIRVGGLTNGVSYTFTVIATNAFGNSPQSAPSAAVTPDGGLPGAQIVVNASPLDDFGGSFPNGTKTNISGPTASASGGVPPYSYNWVRLTGSGGLTVQTGNQPQLIYRSVGTNTENIASFRCTVTDTTGAQGSVDVTIYTTHGTPP